MPHYIGANSDMIWTGILNKISIKSESDFTHWHLWYVCKCQRKIKWKLPVKIEILWSSHVHQYFYMKCFVDQ